jgi:acetyl/propionyl-CoA carboxylase alpha subunit
MPDIKIVTEVAGRVCALPVEVGASLSEGDDIAFVEAMKMEIPVAARPRENSNRSWSASMMWWPRDRSSP